jgi:hypothetical protein
VPSGFSSTSFIIGMQRPPALSTLTIARGENLKAAITIFARGKPDPNTLPGTITTSPSFTWRDTCPKFRTTRLRRDLLRNVATVSHNGV